MRVSDSVASVCVRKPCVSEPSQGGRVELGILPYMLNKQILHNSSRGKMSVKLSFEGLSLFIQVT